MDLGKRLFDMGRKELQHRMGGDDIDRKDVGVADILISFVIARLALQIPSVLINLSLLPLLPIANVGIRVAAQFILLAVKIAFDIVIVVYAAKIWIPKIKKEKEEAEAQAYAAAAAFDPESIYSVPPADPSYQSKSSTSSSTPNFYPYNTHQSASSLWLHRGRQLGNTPVAVQRQQQQTVTISKD